MADATKYAPINGGTLISDLKTQLSLLKIKTRVALAYGFVFAFIAFSVILAFSPSTNSSSPLLGNIFSCCGSRIKSISSENPHRSQFSSNSSDLFPNSAQVQNSTIQPSQTNFERSPNNTSQPPKSTTEPEIVKNQTHSEELQDPAEVLKPNQSTIEALKSPNITFQSLNLNPESSTVKNQTQVKEAHDRVDELKPNVSTIEAPKSPPAANETANLASGPSSRGKNATGKREKRIAEKGDVPNSISSVLRNQSNGTNSGVPVKQGSESLVESLMNCNLFDGNWVRDESYPLYEPGSCSLIDQQFNCIRNGRPDKDYQKLKWKPKGCTLPRLNGSHMLEILRGKRLVFVGDSLNRNMWESLVCILRNSVKDQGKVYEAFGRHHFRGEASYSFVFEDYNCTVEFFVSPFLVREWQMRDKNGTKKETLRLDLIGRLSDQYKNAGFIVFNTGHWWTHEKTSKGEDYYQEGSHVYSSLNVQEAFRKALTTWGRWVDANINPNKTFVFFRGYSDTHFSGGQWNSGGQCNDETEPIRNDTYLRRYPSKMKVLESVLQGMRTQVSYLNITRLTDFRKDGHPSIYRKPHMSKAEKQLFLRAQDCSHWCLPGVPDAWNELLYAELLIRQNQKQQEQKRP
ncbi:unnamed protein product [Ilex paraguariensis]|uniref:Trichome birefringence-like N-terminal domain-containing protein n=1 Tax=Ilex paraguariensis TaxID=185542 RepID=A0ABC8RTY2_9AQUA